MMRQALISAAMLAIVIAMFPVMIVGTAGHMIFELADTALSGAALVAEKLHRMRAGACEEPGGEEQNDT